MTHLGMTTSRRTQRYGGHAKHTFYCSCGRTVSGNGGKQHFKRGGHTRVSFQRFMEIHRAGEYGPTSELVPPTEESKPDA